METLTAILREDPPTLPAATPQALQQIAARCLEKEPERRFQSMKDLAFALRTSSNATSAVHMAIASKSRLKWLWPAVALICLALLFVPRGEVHGNKMKLTPIARDRAAESVPAFSPDGNSVAYLRSSGSNTQLLLRVLSESAPVVLVESVGGRTSLANSPSLSWSPDGAHIFYLDNGRPLRIAVSGGAPRPLSEGLSAAAAIPDGSGLVIARYAEGNKVQLQVTAPDASQPKAIGSYEIPVRIPTFPASLKFSPDGRRLAFIAGGTLAVVDWPSAALRKTHRTEPIIRSFSWMPDSRHGMTAGMFRQGIQAIDTESGETRTLHAGSINHVDIRADGRAAAIVPTTLQSEVVEFTMAGEKVRDIASSVEIAQAPEWSPDGRSLAYRQYLTPDTAAIVIQDLAGGRIRQVVALPVRGTIPFPQFSPDSKRIAYLDNGKLWTILASGGIATPLDSEDSSARPCWSPDGNWLLTRPGGGLAKVPAGGGPAVKLEVRGGSSCAWKAGSIYVTGPDGLQRLPEKGGPATKLGEFAGSLISGVSPDGATLYLLKGSVSQLLAVDAKTGALLKTVEIQADGLVRGVSVHPDGKRLAAWVERTVSDIWMLEGFPLPTTGIERLFRKWKDPE